MRRSTAWTVAVLMGLVFGVTFLLPLGTVVSGGFFVGGKFTLRYLIGVFENPVYAEGLLNSVKIAVGTTLLVVLIAVPLAWLGNRFEFAGKKLLSGLVLVPMVLPPFVGAIGFQQILGVYGSLNTWLGTSIDWQIGRAHV